MDHFTYLVEYKGLTDGAPLSWEWPEVQYNNKNQHDDDSYGGVDWTDEETHDQRSYQSCPTGVPGEELEWWSEI